MRRYLAMVLMVFLLVPPICGLADAPASGAGLTILFAHDLHSNLLPFTRVDGDVSKSVGGFARLKAVLNKERAGTDALTVDAGDFSMGTLFQTIYASHASELRMLGELGFDATTLGNHEFDFGTHGLADMLYSAAACDERLPQLLFHAKEQDVAAKDQDPAIGAIEKPQSPLEYLSGAFAAVNTAKTAIIERNGVRVGLFSAFGESSVEYSPTLELAVPGIVENAKAAVAELKAQGAELIVCLSHSGTNPDPTKSEDERLAAAVPEIDIIVSGHTHTYLYEPIVVGQTAIVSCGEYAQYLGKLILMRQGDRWAVSQYSLIPLDASIAPDPVTERSVKRYMAIVEANYLSRFGGLSFDKVIARVDYPSLRYDDIYRYHDESLLGNLIADAYRTAAQASSNSDVPIAAAVAPAGTIRWSIPQGKLTLADVFNVSSLGVGKDGLSGYPLIDAYITGKELMALCEVDASVAPIMDTAQLFLSGVSYSFNPHRLIFNKVTSSRLETQDGIYAEIDSDVLYRIVCGLFSAQMLSTVKSKSFGILSIVPKDEHGEEIADFNGRILYDAQGAEIKEWYAIAQYLGSFEKTAGVPVIPAYYSVTHGRKIVETQRGLGNYLSHLNAFAWIVYVALIVILALLIIAFYRLVTRRSRRVRKRRRRYARM